jgi:hypothetical protein
MNSTVPVVTAYPDALSGLRSFLRSTGEVTFNYPGIANGIKAISLQHWPENQIRIGAFTDGFTQLAIIKIPKEEDLSILREAHRITDDQAGYDLA